MKSPAILWYPSDFIASTIFWTNEQCGAYIRLLNFQFTVGHLSKDQLEMITKDKVVLSKFIKDKDGLYYNERMENEIIKRKKYSESRSKNKLGKTKTYENDINDISKSYDNHMGNGNINRNININNNINIYDYYMNEIGDLSPKQYETLNEYLSKYDTQKIIDAIDITCNNNKKSFSYFSSVLKNGSLKNKKTNDLPEWIDKNITTEDISTNELEELEKEFEVFS